MRQHSQWLVLVPAAIVLLVFLPILNYELVWDDTIFLRDIPLYRDASLWTEALSQPFVLSPNYFRPVAVLTFMAQLRVGGVDATLLHLVSLLLHAINTVLVALLARHLCPPDMDPTRRALIQVGAGLVYGLHPALVEGVAFVSSQFDLLVTTFLLLALLADSSLQHRFGRPLGVALAFLLAALSKEMALAFVAVLPLWHLARRQRRLSPLGQFWREVRESGDLATYLGVLVALGLYLLLRYAALGYVLYVNPEGTIPTGSFLQHLLLVGRSLARYVVLIIWPFTNLTPIHYSPLPVPTDDLAAWASLIVVMAVLVGLVILVRRAAQSGWLAVAGILSLLPVINVLPLQLDGGAFVAERFLLFPVALLSLALVPLVRPLAAWWNLRVSRVPAWTLPLVWLALSIGTLQLTLPHWQSDVALWSWGGRRAPNSALPPTNLALAYIGQGSYERALAEIDRALALDPTQAGAWNNLGLALFYRGEFAAAQSAFEEAVSREADNAIYWNNLAAALREQDKLEEAQQVLLEEVLPRSPDLPIAHLNLGIIYMRMERPDLAVQHLQEALRLLPPEQQGEAQALLAQMEDPELWLRLGDNLLASGDPERALSAFDQARALGAQPAEVATGLSAALIDQGAWSEAEAVLQQALQQAPNDARLYNNLGVVAREQGDTEAARQYFERAAELAPEWDLPQENLDSLEPETP